MAKLQQKAHPRNTRYKHKSPRHKEQIKKFLNNDQILHIINGVKTTPMIKNYWNVYHCSDDIIIKKGMKRVKRCKERMCNICNGINTMRLMKGYKADILAMKEPIFLTVSRRTVEGEKLPKEIKEYQNKHATILDYSKEPTQKKLGIKLIGIKKAEITISKDKPEENRYNHYHYHFHMVIDGWENAKWYHDQWLRLNTLEFAEEWGQKIKKVDKTTYQHEDEIMLELFKYMFKPEYDNRVKEDAVKIDFVYKTLKGKKMISTFGGIKAIRENLQDDDLKAEETNKLDGNYNWILAINDWVNQMTGELYSGHEIPKGLLEKSGYNKNTDKLIYDKHSL